MSAGRFTDRGSATIWVLSAVAVLMLVSAVGALRAAAVLARHRAEAAADLAAVAAAGQIGVSDRACGLAAVIARGNGAQLRTCALSLAADGRSGTVTIHVAVRVRFPVVGGRQVVASARAARQRARPP